MKRQTLNHIVMKGYPYPIDREYLYSLRAWEGFHNARELGTSVQHWSKNYIKDYLLKNHKKIK